MALKLNKTCREIPGSLAEAWRAVATEMESRGEVHRQFSKSLTEEIVKPLKEMVDGQHKTRKTVRSELTSNHAFNYSLLSYYTHPHVQCLWYNCTNICLVKSVSLAPWNCLVVCSGGGGL